MSASESERKVSVVVACRNAGSGSASMPIVMISLGEDNYQLGEHYDLAEAAVKKQGYEGPFVCFDDQEFRSLFSGVDAASDVSFTEADGTKKIDVLVACRNADGGPVAVAFSVEVAEDAYALGKHYEYAQAGAEKAGYEGPFVCFDDHEIPAAKACVAQLRPEPEAVVAPPVLVVGGGKSMALVAMYLGKGFLAGEMSEQESEQWGGELGALDFVADYVPAVLAVEQKADQDGVSFPGVFHYEVVEPMGEWLRENPEMSNAAFMDALAHKVNAFFGQDCSALLQAAMESLPAGYMVEGYVPPAWQPVQDQDHDSPSP